MQGHAADLTRCTHLCHLNTSWNQTDLHGLEKPRGGCHVVKCHKSQFPWWYSFTSLDQGQRKLERVYLVKWTVCLQKWLKCRRRFTLVGFPCRHRQCPVQCLVSRANTLNSAPACSRPINPAESMTICPLYGMRTTRFARVRWLPEYGTRGVAFQRNRDVHNIASVGVLCFNLCGFFAGVMTSCLVFCQVARRIRDNVFIVGISKVLDDLSIYHQVGTVLASGQLAVELLLEKEGKMYGVVPVHKMSMNRNGGRTVLGEVKLAGQLLEAQDLPVIGHILMSEWEACGDDADARKQLIQKRIKVGGPA